MKLSLLTRPLGKATNVLRLSKHDVWDHPGREGGVQIDQLSSLELEDPSPAVIKCIDYGPDCMHEQEVEDLSSFLQENNRPKGTSVRWINIAGLKDVKAIEAVARYFDLHPLIVEDLLDVTHRPKAEENLAFGEEQSGCDVADLFVTMRLIHLIDDHVGSETIHVLVSSTTVVTLQQSHEDAWEPIRNRLEKTDSRIRSADTSFLLYTLIDRVVDSYYPTIEHLGDIMESLEESLLGERRRLVNDEVYAIKRELIMLRREAWPMREIINSLTRDSNRCISKKTQRYLRDVYDHIVHIMDIIETFRDGSATLIDLQMNTVNARMNEVMKVLTIIATIFIPLSFLAGIYGMNFDYMPGLKERGGFWIFWGVCVIAAGAMLAWFARKGWLSK